MNRRPSFHRLTGAFTLLEVLIAVMAFAIVLAAINGVFYSALRLRNRTVEAVDQAMPMQRALDIIKRDLAHLVPPGGTLSGDLTTSLMTSDMSGQISPEFYTASGLMDPVAPWGDVQRVSYGLLESTNELGTMDLYRLANRNLLPTLEETPVPQWLMSGVRRVAFLYLKETQWQETWDSTVEESKLPAAIKVQIELETQQTRGTMEAPIELVVPITMQSRTNLTETASGGVL